MKNGGVNGFQIFRNLLLLIYSRIFYSNTIWPSFEILTALDRVYSIISREILKSRLRDYLNPQNLPQTVTISKIYM